MRCDRVYRWRLLLEEYDPAIVYTKGMDNTIADTVSHLKDDMDLNTCKINVHVPMKVLVLLPSSYVDTPFDINPFQTLSTYVGCSIQKDDHFMQEQVYYLIANNSSMAEETYSPTIYESVEAQASHHLFSKYLKDKPFKNEDSKIHPKVIDDIRDLVYENKRLVVPIAKIQNKVIQ